MLISFYAIMQCVRVMITLALLTFIYYSLTIANINFGSCSKYLYFSFGLLGIGSTLDWTFNSNENNNNNNNTLEINK